MTNRMRGAKLISERKRNGGDIRMQTMNCRNSVLDMMRKQLPKARVEQHAYMSRNSVPEYKYINYDLELIKKEYECVSAKIMEM